MRGYNLGAQAIIRARQSIGVKEETPNWGRFVSIYLAFVGIFRPSPWCSAFTSYKIHQAARDLGLKAKWPKQGYVQSVVNWAKQRGNFSTIPTANSIFVVFHPTLNRYAHIGFIDEVSTDGSAILTIEGNSNTDGSREGREVVSKWRTWDRNRHRCLQII